MREHQYDAPEDDPDDHCVECERTVMYPEYWADAAETETLCDRCALIDGLAYKPAEPEGEQDAT